MLILQWIKTCLILSTASTEHTLSLSLFVYYDFYEFNKIWLENKII